MGQYLIGLALVAATLVLLSLNQGVWALFPAFAAVVVLMNLLHRT